MNTKNRQKSPRVVDRQLQQKHIQVRISTADADFSIDQKIEQYIDSNLLAIKTRLNESKSKLDVYFTATSDEKFKKIWLKFTNLIDTYKSMRFKIEKIGAKIVTNAWMKYWELYSQYPLVPIKSDREFTVFFNAELPGAALVAFNHFMKAMRPDVKFRWFASSLAPSDDKASLGDTYGLYEKNKSNWLMSLGKPIEGTYHNNGDATIFDNLLNWESRIGPNSATGGVDFYSHDAGINVSDDFNEQESANAKLHLGCAIAGFMTLRPGGVFIAKQYTFFETFTWNLILIYAKLFDQFYICKPLTSRPYNSEIYLVGIGFKGFNAEIRKTLIDRLQNFNVLPFVSVDAMKVHLTEQFMDICRFARCVFNTQAGVISENCELFEGYKNNLGDLEKGLEEAKYQKISSWLKLYPVRAIRDSDQMASNA